MEGQESADNVFVARLAKNHFLLLLLLYDSFERCKRASKQPLLAFQCSVADRKLAFTYKRFEAYHHCSRDSRETVNAHCCRLHS